MTLIEQPLAQREVGDGGIACFKRKKFFLSMNPINLHIEKKLHPFLYLLKCFVIVAFRLGCSHAYIKFQLVKQESNGKGWLNFIPSFSVCAYLCNIPTRSIQNFTAFFVFDFTVKRKHMLEMMAMVVFLPLKWGERLKLLRSERFNRGVCQVEPCIY